MHTLKVIAIAALLIPTVARTETLEFDLPGLVGYYSDPILGGVEGRAGTITYHGGPVNVHAITVEMSYTVTIGEMMCPDSWGQPQSVPWGIDASFLVSKDAESRLWYGWNYIEANGVGQSQTAAVPFTHLPPPFSLVTDGDRLTISQHFGGGGYIPECSPVSYPEGSIFSAKVIIEVEPALPVESVTWGRIKALYR